MANEPLAGAHIVAAVKSSDATLPAKITVNDALTPPGMVVDVADRALRDLGTVDADITAHTQTNLPHVTISAASTNATSVKGSAGRLYSVQAFNINAAARYLKLYNTSGAPNVGTDTPVKTLLVPGNSAGAGLVLYWGDGLPFSTGIAFALTTGIAHTDTGAVAANELAVNLDYL